MPQHGQASAKEHYCNWYKHKNNPCPYNNLILENSINLPKN